MAENDPSLLLLLTAGLRPSQETASLVVRSAELREAQYRAAVEYYDEWIPQLGGYLVDNSQATKEDIDRVVEGTGFIASMTNNEGSRVEKGLLEFRAIDQFVRPLPDHTKIVKITGRLQVRRLNVVVEAASRREIVVDFKTGLDAIDSRCMAFTADAWRRYFAPALEGIDESAGRYFEHQAASATLRAKADGLLVEQVRRPLGIRGISGSTGDGYRASIRSWLAPSLKSAVLNARA